MCDTCFLDDAAAFGPAIFTDTVGRHFKFDEM
jgi:hypothetical protein